MDTRRSLTDWIGCAFYGSMAAHLLWSSRPMSLFLLPTFAHQVLIAVAFLTRTPAAATASGWGARAAAYTGSLGLVVFIGLVRAFAPEWLTATSAPALRSAGILLWFAGSVFGVWAVWHLRRSFSLEAEARALVTSGPYRLARHPIYTGYLFQYAGMWLVFPTLPLGLALAGWLAVLLLRVGYEEAVLRSAFPAYAGYAVRVGRFLPRAGFLRRAVDRTRLATVGVVRSDERGLETIEWIVVGALIMAIVAVVYPGTLQVNLTAAMTTIGNTIIGLAG